MTTIRRGTRLSGDTDRAIRVVSLFWSRLWLAISCAASRRTATRIALVALLAVPGLARAAIPTVTSVSPSSGSTAGGTVVTITGATSVQLGASPATSFTVVSATQVVAVTTANSAGTVDITVTTPGGTSATNGSDQFTYLAPPVASAASATVGNDSSANPITLNLSGGTATSVAVASGPSHGAATVSGTSISYTPTLG